MLVVNLHLPAEPSALLLRLEGHSPSPKLGCDADFGVSSGKLELEIFGCHNEGEREEETISKPKKNKTKQNKQTKKSTIGSPTLVSRGTLRQRKNKKKKDVLKEEVKDAYAFGYFDNFISQTLEGDWDC